MLKQRRVEIGGKTEREFISEHLTSEEWDESVLCVLARFQSVPCRIEREQDWSLVGNTIEIDRPNMHEKETITISWVSRSRSDWRSFVVRCRSGRREIRWFRADTNHRSAFHMSLRNRSQQRSEIPVRSSREDSRIRISAVPFGSSSVGHVESLRCNYGREMNHRGTELDLLCSLVPAGELPMPQLCFQLFACHRIDRLIDFTQAFLGDLSSTRGRCLDESLMRRTTHLARRLRVLRGTSSWSRHAIRLKETESNDNQRLFHKSSVSYFIIKRHALLKLLLEPFNQGRDWSIGSFPPLTYSDVTHITIADSWLKRLITKLFHSCSMASRVNPKRIVRNSDENLNAEKCPRHKAWQSIWAIGNLVLQGTDEWHG